jgi:hypothetical protein
MLKRERMMPQYQDVRTDQGDCLPLGRMVGQLPVDVRTPARRADWGGMLVSFDGYRACSVVRNVQMVLDKMVIMATLV